MSEHSFSSEPPQYWPAARKRESPREILKRIILENLLSSNVSGQDIERACRIMQKTKNKRVTKTHVAPIFLN